MRSRVTCVSLQPRRSGSPSYAVLAQAQQVVGRRLVVEYGSARGNLRDTILAGQDFEVALLLPDVNEELLRQGKILPEKS